MPLKEKHLKFANEYMRTGKPMESYLTAYPEATNRTASSSAQKLLRKPDIQEYIKQQTKLMDEAKADTMREAYKEIAQKEVASIAELDMILTQIVRGTATVDHIIPVYETTFDGETGKKVKRTVAFNNVNRRPNNNEKMRAAHLLYRRQGELLPVAKRPGEDPGDTPEETNEAARVIVLSNGEKLPFTQVFNDEKTGTE